MPRIGGFTKTRNYVKRQRALGRYRSPYQVGGTIFGRSMTPMFPMRARPWELTRLTRIKARRPRRKRSKR